MDAQHRKAWMERLPSSKVQPADLIRFLAIHTQLKARLTVVPG